MADESDSAAEGSDAVLAVVADPEQGRQHLPYLLGLLDDDEPRQRLRGALALCLAVDASPELLDPVVRRLVDRLDGDPPVEVPHALDYLAAREPKAVDEVVTDLADERELRAREPLYQSGAGYAGGGPPGVDADDAVGRTRSPGGPSGTGDGADGPRIHSETSTGRDASEPANGGVRDSESETAGETEKSPDDDVSAESDDAAAAVPDDELTRGDLAAVARRLSAVTDRSRFDDLTVLTDGHRNRFAVRYRAVGTDDETEVPLSLAVFRVPDDATEESATFVRSLQAALDAWTGVDEHGSVLTVHDWGVDPRPWAAVEYAGSSLADHDGLALADAVATVVDVADAVAHAHQHGVVHGALDPETVVFPGSALTEADRQRPRVTAPGLARVYAEYRSLARFLDPRYAAPEHYAERFGRVDHATDVYGIGALLYRLVSGEPPYDGRPEEIRAGVCADRSPLPSEVDPDVPAEIDRIVRKATATRKLTRYETVNNLRRELRGIDTDGG